MNDDMVRQVDARVASQWEEAAPGWRRWEPYFGSGSLPVTLAMMRQLEIDAATDVLDVGSGLGDPGLAIAAYAGSVTMVDPCAPMLAAARERADAWGLSNTRFIVGDVWDASLSEQTFDRVSARFSLMFYADPPAGLARMWALLRPGGRLSAAVWTSFDENPMFAMPSEVLRRHVEIEPPHPDEPGPMRFSKDGALASLMQSAGFRDVCVEAVRVYLFAPDADTYWTMLTEMSSQFRGRIEGLAESVRASVEHDLKAEVQRFARDGVIRIPGQAWVGVGVR